MKRALQLLLAASVVADASTQNKRLADLDADELELLLRSWRLDTVFARGFKANNYDGDVLKHLVGMQIPADLPSLQPKFPNADVMQWKKLQEKVSDVISSGGIVDLSELQIMSEEESDNDHRQLAEDAASEFSGIQILKRKAMVSMGPSGDISLMRKGNASLHVDTESVSFAANDVTFSARDGFVVNGTDLLQCCREGKATNNETLAKMQVLLDEQYALMDDVRVLSQELFLLEKRFNMSCRAVAESAYDCDDIVSDYTEECNVEVASSDYVWCVEDRAPARCLDCMISSKLIAWL